MAFCHWRPRRRCLSFWFIRATSGDERATATSPRGVAAGSPPADPPREGAAGASGTPLPSKRSSARDSGSSDKSPAKPAPSCSTSGVCGVESNRWALGVHRRVLPDSGRTAGRRGGRSNAMPRPRSRWWHREAVARRYPWGGAWWRKSRAARQKKIPKARPTQRRRKA